MATENDVLLDALHVRRTLLEGQREEIDAELKGLERRIMSLRARQRGEALGIRGTGKTAQKAMYWGFIMLCLEEGQVSYTTRRLGDLASFHFGSGRYGTLRSHLHRMEQAGLIRREGISRWGLASAERDAAPKSADCQGSDK